MVRAFFINKVRCSVSDSPHGDVGRLTDPAAIDSIICGGRRSCCLGGGGGKRGSILHRFDGWSEGLTEGGLIGEPMRWP